LNGTVPFGPPIGIVFFPLPVFWGVSVPAEWPITLPPTPFPDALAAALTLPRFAVIPIPQSFGIPWLITPIDKARDGSWIPHDWSFFVKYTPTLESYPTSVDIMLPLVSAFTVIDVELLVSAVYTPARSVLPLLLQSAAFWLAKKL
jgi:hypothetical protein